MTSTRSGPVRSETARLAILEATARLFDEHGYDAMTMARIATEAGVGKQTIYRWWSSKADLVAECLVEGMLLPVDVVVPDTGDLRADLVSWILAIFRTVGRPEGEGTVRSLISASIESADIGLRVRDSLTGEESLASRLQAATGTSANLYPGAPLDEIAESLVGTVVLRVISRTPPEPAEAQRMVDAVLGPPTR
ncbi:TetR/AcrR family transcriptional regulator [Georgenia sp. Z1344]|uniref:TetR/AcrR family transcriptional regulator n=1 Tax=Georgenia sp. Z1344 TaxID=3416706 RepID=UPI003CFA4267